jgi:hypothetical protein
MPLSDGPNPGVSLSYITHALWTVASCLVQVLVLVLLNHRRRTKKQYHSLFLLHPFLGCQAIENGVKQCTTTVC